MPIEKRDGEIGGDSSLFYILRGKKKGLISELPLTQDLMYSSDLFYF